MPSLEKIYAFVDTNVFLEYQDYTQLKWPELLDAREVVLVVAPMVRREIEKHRTDPKSPRKQKQARSVSAKLMDLAISVAAGHEAIIPERPNVTYLELSRSPKLAKYPDLSADVQDDHVIASMLDFREEYPDHSVILVAGDRGLILKARLNDFMVRYLEDEYRRPDEPTAEQREIRDLHRRIAVLESSSPQLEVSFKGSVEGSLILPAMKPIDEVKKKHRLEVLELIDDLIGHKWRSDQRREPIDLTDSSQFPHKLAPISYSLTHKHQKLKVPHEVITRIISEAQKLGIGVEHFNEELLQPRQVFLERSLLPLSPLGYDDGGTVSGEDEAWYWAVMKLDDRLQEIHRNLHDENRKRQYRSLELCLENTSGTKAEALDIELAVPEDPFALVSELDLYYQQQEPYPGFYRGLNRSREPKWVLSERRFEKLLTATLSSLKPGESYCWEVGFVRAPKGDEAINLNVKILGNNLPEPVEVRFSVRSQ